MAGLDGARGGRRTGLVLMAAGAVGALALAAVLAIWGHRGGSPATAPGALASASASPSPAEGIFGTPPPALQLRPRLLDGAILATLTIPGAASPVEVVEGLVESATTVGHDASSAYPGEPHAVVLEAGPLVSVPALTNGTVLSIAAGYGVFRYQVASVAPPPSTPAGDAPELRLVVSSGGSRTQVTATLVPGDPNTAAEIAEEVAVTQAQQQAAASGSGGATAPDRFVAPCSGPVSQGFGPTDYTFEFPFVYKGVYYAHFHTGLDIAVPLGTQIRAAAPGTVVLATTNLANGVPVGFGTYILIAHGGGVYTLYGHLGALGVHAEQQVQAGQVIALSGSTGNSTGPHLHFEVRQGVVPVDPLPLIR